MTQRTWRITHALPIFLIAINQLVYGGQQELLEEVRVAHQASIASFQSFACDVSLSYDPKPIGGNESGKCWRCGESVRCQSESPVGKEDVLVKGDRVICVNKYPSARQTSEVSATISENKRPIKCDAWSHGLITFYGCDRFRVSFDELLSQPHELHTVKTVQDEGRNLVYVDISHDRAHLEIWFDPQINYLVRKLRMETAGPEKDRLRSEQRVISFREAAPGIFFPERVDTHSVMVGRPEVSMSVTFSNVQVNQPVPNETFQLRFPPDIIVTDLIQDTVRKTDSQGEPTLQATNREGKPLQLSKGAPIPLAAEQAQNNQVTQVESQSWTRWLLPVSLILLACSGFFWLLSKWRRRLRAI